MALVIKKAPRLAWLDMAKGVCMILVIYGHCCNTFGLVNQWICSFFMGLYFIGGGYTYRFKKQWLISDIKGTLIPYLLWGTVGILFAIVKAAVSHDTSDIDIVNKIYRMVSGLASDNYPLWFLAAFFVSKMAYNLVNLLLNKFSASYGRRRIAIEFTIVFTISAAAYCYTLLKPFGHSIMRFDTGLVMLPFFTVGRYLPLFFEIICRRHFEIYILLLALTINIVSGILLNDLVSVNSNEYGNVIMFVISSVSGTIAVYLLCMFMEKIGFLMEMLSYIGYNSLIILCSHAFFLFAIGATEILIFPHLHLWPIAHTLLCLLIMWPCLKPLNRFTHRVQTLVVKS